MPGDSADPHHDAASSWDPHWLVFTKPWPSLDAQALASMVSSLGFDGVELPVRDGFQIEPRNVHALGEFAARMADSGVVIRSVATTPTREALDACREAGVGMIRIMAEVGPDGYIAAESRLRALLDDMLPALEELDMTVGIQPHHGRYVSTSAGLRRVLDDYPHHVSAIWDAAHNALAGEDTDLSLEQLAGRVGLVNLKDARYERVSAEDGSVSTGSERWRARFVPGGQGMADWSAAFSVLDRVGYRGDVCLTAEYDGLERPLDTVIREDLARARDAFAARNVG